MYLIHYVYCTAELLDRLMMESQESDCPIPQEQKTAQKAIQLAREFVSNYVDLTLPGDNSTANTRL